MAGVQDLILEDEQEFSQLTDILRERFDMPTDEWWATTQEKFNQLRFFLGQTDSAAISGDVQDYFSLRTNALPAIVVLPAGSHALRLTALNEPLECFVFGTLMPSRYLDVFWEKVKKAQQAREIDVIVHELNQSDVPRILLTYGHLLFELRYMKCEHLVRKYRNILDAPRSFLHDRDSCIVHIESAVLGLQQAERLRRDFLDARPSPRLGYYFVRAWAKIFGDFGRWGLTATDIVQSSMPADDEKEDLTSLIHTFFQSKQKEYFDDFESQWKFFATTSNEELIRGSSIFAQLSPSQFLNYFDTVPLHIKICFPHYVRVSVISTNPSRLLIGQWLSFVEQQLPQLSDQLIRRFIPRAKARYWSHRIVSPSSTISQRSFHVPGSALRQNSSSDNSFYEGHYILGVQIFDIVQLTTAVQEVFDSWKFKSLFKGPVAEQGHICLSILTAAQLEQEDYQPCTQVWPRPALVDEKAPINLFPDEPSMPHPFRLKMPQKVPAAEASGAPKTRLRPASDVLSRLRHDSNYDIDEFLVGYRDRYSAQLMEKPVRLWARDTTDEEFIPEHRIVYFKRYTNKDVLGGGELIWDRENKVDKLFGKAE